MTPLIIFMIIAVVLTYVLVRFSRPARCRLQEAGEGFADVKDVDLQSCPAGSNQYYDKNDDSKCCDGQVVGRECRGETLCRLSPTADPDAPPYCADYMAAASFNLKGSQIQNPDTGLCLAKDTSRKTIGNLVVGVKCDGSHLWTKNALGQIIEESSGLCLTRMDQGIGYVYNLQKCSPIPEQTFTYDAKKNILQSSAKGSTPMYLQDFSTNPRVNLLLEKMSYDEYKKFLEKKNYKISENTMEQYYKVYHSDENKPARMTFLSLQPGDNEFVSNIHAMFGSK